MAKGVYEGKKPYIFISYSHKDSARVLPLILELQKRGFRVWYDEGIEAGTEWPAYIERHLEGSAAVVVFLSNNSIQSVNCRNEVNVAAELGKEILVAQLDEDVTYQYGMRLQLSSRQKIFCYRHTDRELLLDELIKVKMLEPCQENGVEPASSADIVETNTTKQNRMGKITIGAMALGVILIVTLLVVLLWPKDPTPPENNSPAISTTPTGEISSTEDKKVQMSDELFDFTFELNGNVYQLPCSYQAFAQNGWTISSTGYNSETLIGGDRYDSFYMAKDGYKILVYIYNFSGNSKKISDCKIGGIEYDNSYENDFKIAKGITTASTAEQIKDAFGVPNEEKKGDGYERLTYRLGDSSYNYVSFYCSEDFQYSSIELQNFVKSDADTTVTNTEKPSYLSKYKEPTSIGENIFSSVVNIGGDLYQLPAPVHSFLDNGWVITQQSNAVVSGGKDSVKMQRDGKEISLFVLNFAEYQTTPENCAVYSVSISSEESIPIVLPGEIQQITLGMQKAELEAALPDKFNYSESIYSSYYSYFESKDRVFSISINVDNESELVSSIKISCESWEY